MKKVLLGKLRSHKILWPLIISSCLSLVLLAIRCLAGNTTRYWWLSWNLGLAWLPPILIYLLLKVLEKGRWLSGKGIAYTVLWLVFLPNSFYLVSDIVHFKPTGEVSLAYDAVMFMTIALNGLLLGFVAVYLFHKELLKRLAVRQVNYLLVGIFILCGFAIYLGRYLGWNSWDIIINPAGILYDLSERIVRPTSYPNTFTITTLFTGTLLTIYYTIYKLVEAIGANNSKD